MGRGAAGCEDIIVPLPVMLIPGKEMEGGGQENKPSNGAECEELPRS